LQKYYLQTMASNDLTSARMDELREEFYKDDKNRLAQNVVSRSDPLETCMSRISIEETQHVFNNKVDEVKPVTSQKSSGRCWIFAVMNAMRIPFMKKLEIEDFEFSQSYLFFWDKIERSNYFLNTIASVYKRGESPDGRLVSFMLHDPINDGGQWDMVANLIEKHGVMPKKCYPETFSNESSRQMNNMLKSKMREFSYALYNATKNDATDEAIKTMINDQMKIIYRIVGICLGIPPKTFTWEYYDKSKKSHKIENISPLDFYQKHVQEHFNVSNKICLVTDPRPENPVGKTYTVDGLGNVIGGRLTVYNNQPIETLVDLASKSIQAGEPVWFGCDVSKYFARKVGLLTMDLYDYELVFGTKVNIGLNKAERLIYGDCAMNHAMLLTAVHIENDQPTKWRIENSWGESSCEKGYICMTNDWFKEFVFEIVVDKSYCSDEILDVFKQEPTVLPAWDPMGSLARS